MTVETYPEQRRHRIPELDIRPSLIRLPQQLVWFVGGSPMLPRPEVHRLER